MTCPRKFIPSTLPASVPSGPHHLSPGAQPPACSQNSSHTLTCSQGPPFHGFSLLSTLSKASMAALRLPHCTKASMAQSQTPCSQNTPTITPHPLLGCALPPARHVLLYFCLSNSYPSFKGASKATSSVKPSFSPCLGVTFSPVHPSRLPAASVSLHGVFSARRQ